MPSCIVYLDESGDLGWSFDKPYRAGGSSRYLTISALEVPVEEKAHPKRLIRDLYDKYKRLPANEMKWSGMSADQRRHFSEGAKDLCAKKSAIKLHAIVVQKENVLAHIRQDGNKLYNYMIKLALLDRFATYEVVTLVPDPRSIRVKSGNSLHDYLQTELWFTKKAGTNLKTNPMDSKTCLGLQFADMVAGTVQSHFEDNESVNFQAVTPHLTLHKLFFSI